MEEAARPNFGDYFPILKKLDFQGIKRKQTVYFDKIFGVLGFMIEERLQHQENEKNCGSAPNNDLLHYLLNLGSENSDIKMGKTEFKHLLLVFLSYSSSLSHINLPILISFALSDSIDIGH